MSIEGQKFYPGDDASSVDLLILAGEYQRASDALFAIRRPKAPLSLYPYRLALLQAIELYLIAFLREQGRSSAELRGTPHNLSSLADLAMATGLRLRKRTASRLRTITTSREYLVARYGPEQCQMGSPLTGLSAALQDIATKVESALSRK